jgi:hypothetical protein
MFFFLAFLKNDIKPQLDFEEVKGDESFMSCGNEEGREERMENWRCIKGI